MRSDPGPVHGSPWVARLGLPAGVVTSELDTASDAIASTSKQSCQLLPMRGHRAGAGGRRRDAWVRAARTAPL